MDPTYVQGLREAKALLDEGVLTQEEFNKEKNELDKQREERRAGAAATSREERRAVAGATTSSELAGLVEGDMWRLKLVQPGQPPPPAELPNINISLADGPRPPCPPHSRKRSREEAYTVPPGMRHALKPLSKMPGRENMPDPRVRCALCTEKGSVYCLECTTAKGIGIYALCCPSSGRLCACQHWSDMVTGTVASWLPNGKVGTEIGGAGPSLASRRSLDTGDNKPNKDTVF